MSWTLIEHQALTSSAASVTLGSGGTIPQTYKTLKVLISARGAGSVDTHVDLAISINGSTSNISVRYLYGTGSAAASTTNTYFAGVFNNANATSNTFGNAEITFSNYTTSNAKPYSSDSVTENNGTQAFTNLMAGLFNSSSAITSLTFSDPYDSNGFAAGSTFTLYGLA